MKINADRSVGFAELNEKIRSGADKKIVVRGCLGQRYIAAGLPEKKITIYGTPGNALGAYLDGAEIDVFGNVQDATGDTMNGGEIIVRGSAGDATGYAMRGGKIYVRKNTGYRAGIHMKAYLDRKPVLVVGGCAGSFLGEYLAGGIIVVLAAEGGDAVNHFCGTGMHGGKIYLRCDRLPHKIPSQVNAERISGFDDGELCAVVRDFCSRFGDLDAERLLGSNYFLLTPNTANPYKRLYTDN